MATSKKSAAKKTGAKKSSAKKTGAKKTRKKSTIKKIAAGAAALPGKAVKASKGATKRARTVGPVLQKAGDLLITGAAVVESVTKKTGAKKSGAKKSLRQAKKSR